MKRQRHTFDLRITDRGGDRDGDAFLRLRALLKRMLRSYCYRCARIVEVKPTPDQEGNHEEPTDEQRHSDR